MRFFLVTVVVIVAMVIFVSFKPMSSQTFVKWVEDYDNGWHQEIKSGGWIIDVQKEPLAYVALQRFRESLTCQMLELFIEEQRGEEYFLIRLSRSDGKDLIDYFGKERHKALLNYFSFEFQNAITLIGVDGKEVKPSLFHFERDNTLRNSRTFLVTFNSDGSDEFGKVVINSNLLSVEPIEVSFSTKKLPNLSL